MTAKNHKDEQKLKVSGRIGLKKRRLITIGMIAVVLPLSLMMGLQYWWLQNLERTSTIARDANRKNYLELISQKTEFNYTKIAEEVLSIPSETLLGPKETLLKHLHWAWPNQFSSAYRQWEEQAKKSKKKSSYKKRQWLSAGKYLYVQNFEGEDPGLRFYDPRNGNWLEDVPEQLGDTVYWSNVYWVVMYKQQQTVDIASYIVDERDPDYPLIVNPVVNEAGKVVGVAGVVVDVSYFREKFLPKLLENAEPLLADLKDNTVRVYDGRQNIIYEASKGSVSFSNSVDEIYRGNLKFIFKDWTITISGNPSMTQQLAGTNFWFNISLAVILALMLSGGILLALRSAAKEMELSEMKSDFVSNVSHELRTPLASIRVFGELLRHGRAVSPEKVREYGEYIETEGRRLSRLINNILDFSKIESGQKLYQFESANVEDVLSEVIRTFEVRLQDRDLHIQFESKAANLPLLRIDTDAMSQVFFNLLDNGVKYGGEGERLLVSLQMDDAEIIIKFRDYGVGIAKAELNKIFDRFHRVGTGLVHDVKGSGLGLSIVRHVVEAHRGRVEVSSEVGKGSTFTIRLPLDEVEPKARRETLQTDLQMKEEPT